MNKEFFPQIIGKNIKKQELKDEINKSKKESFLSIIADLIGTITMLWWYFS